MVIEGPERGDMGDRGTTLMLQMFEMNKQHFQETVDQLQAERTKLLDAQKNTLPGVDGLVVVGIVDGAEGAETTVDNAEKASGEVQ
jgi:hypothetical protein